MALTAAPAVTMTDALEQREIVTLLLLPFFLLAFALGMSQTWRHPARTVEAVRPAPPIAATTPAAVDIAAPALRLPGSAPAIEAVEVRLAAPAMVVPQTPPAIDLPVAPVITLPLPRLALPLSPPEFTGPELRLAAPSLALPSGPPEIVVPEPAPEPEPQPRLAMPLPAPVPSPSLPKRITPPSDVAACPATPGFGLVSYSPVTVDPALGFGERLAIAARAQLGEVVVYNDKYRRMAYPMGDTHALYGVCTDVIVRAYRALGVDLQELVQKARIGSGDTNIDHRRTETLRRLFASRGQSLAITTFSENYLPGDIVTYHRPQNRHLRSHIAIVSDLIAPSGRPMIIHNRGWGPQIEDGLFVDRITGHYRFHPSAAPADMVASAKLPQQATPGAESAAPAAAALSAAALAATTTAARPVQKAAYSVPARKPKAARNEPPSTGATLAPQ